MKKISLILFLIFVLSFIFVNANEYWSQEANANYDLGLGTRFIAYGSNYLNPIDNVTGNDYVLCPITKSDYTPIVSDFGQTGVLKVVVTDKSIDKLSVYSSDCSLFAEISVGEDIVAMPVLLRPKNYFNQQIVVLTSTHLKSYEYDMDLGYFVEEVNIGYGSVTYTPVYLTCLDEYVGSVRSPKCVGIFIGGSTFSDSVIFDMINESFTYEFNELLHPTYLYEYTGYNGLSNFRNPIDDYDFYIPYGFYKRYLDSYYGNLLDEIGDYLTEYDGDYDFGSTESNYKDSSSFIARIGNSYRIFSYRHTGGGAHIYSSVFINDLSGNNLLYLVSDEIGVGSISENMANISYKRFSNWAVADYDKDGSNEACFLVKNVDNEIWLQCYESTLSQSNGDIRVNYTGVMDNISNFVLADFDSNKDVLGVATREGIFYPTEKVYSTGKTSDFGYTITTFKDIYSQTPMYIYTDDNEGFIVYADISIDSCGNGDCEYWENPLSCYDDCYQESPEEIENGSIGTLCKTDSDCNAGLKCVYGVCSKSGFNEDCYSDSDCVSGNCLNGLCTKPTLWQNIEASKNEQFGSDTPTNNFISLFFIIGISLAVGHYVNMWGGFISFFILAIFFTLVGWLSPFILIGMFIIGVIALVFGIMIGNTQG